jgi:hypothetical protein
MILLQDPNIPVATNPVEIDAAIIDILSELNNQLSWLSNGYGRAYKNRDARNGGILFFPEIYLGTQNNSQRYLNVTPDNDKGGSCFFFVSRETITEFQTGMYGYLNYQVGIIFSCNMELIQSTLLSTEIYQQTLIAQVRNVLSRQLLGKSYKLTIQSIEYLLENVFTEFNIQDESQVEKAPFTHFRVNCSIVLPEACPVPEIPPLVACKSLDFDGVNERLITGTEAALNIEWSTAFSIEMWVKLDTEIPAFQTLLTTRSGNGITIRRQRTNGLLYFELWGSAGTETRIYANTNIVLNQWHHLVFTSDGTGLQAGMEIYVNDVLQPKVNLGGNDINTGTMQNAATSMKVMNYTTQYADGKVRSVRMWSDRVLSAGNVNALWNGNTYNPSPPHPTDLIADYDMAAAVWNGLRFDVADGSGVTAGLTSENMEEIDLVDDCPAP